MQLVFSPEARWEFEATERYYEVQVVGLGKAFRDEVRAGLRRIRSWPLACPVERGTIRRAVLGRFPYKLMYSVEAEVVYVIAVAHQHRQPAYWTDRTDA